MKLRMTMTRSGDGRKPVMSIVAERLVTRPQPRSTTAVRRPQQRPAQRLVQRPRPPATVSAACIGCRRIGASGEVVYVGDAKHSEPCELHGHRQWRD